MTPILAVQIGTVGQWVTLVALVVGAWIFYRGGGGAAIQSLETANRVLEREKARLEGEIKELTETIAHLRAQTDVAVVIKPLLDWTVQHERRAQQRHGEQLAEHKQQLVVLDLIAKRLGPDQNGEGT